VDLSYSTAGGAKAALNLCRSKLGVGLFRVALYSDVSARSRHRLIALPERSPGGKLAGFRQRLRDPTSCRKKSGGLHFLSSGFMAVLERDDNPPVLRFDFESGPLTRQLQWGDFASSMSTTSRALMPREKANCLPSRDQSKPNNE
jgi:hypothetical protein